jgi:hypothetical protein
MKAKEKAKELVYKFDDVMEFSTPQRFARQCALIAVDEIQKAIDFDWMEVQNLGNEHRFWDSVKEEIEKL